MALVTILRSKKKSKRKARSVGQGTVGQGTPWPTYWCSRKPARRSSPSLQTRDCKKPIAEIDGCCEPSTPLVSSPEEFPSALPENTPACPAYNPWANTPEVDLWAERSKYFTFLSKYMTSATALSSPSSSPEYTPNFPEPLPSSTPLEYPSALPENTPARPVYNPWGTNSEIDLWAPRSKYFTFSSKYMTSACSSQPDSPQYTPNFLAAAGPLLHL